MSRKRRTGIFTCLLSILFVATTTFAQSTTTQGETTGSVPALNVTIPVFQPGIPDDPSVFRDQQVFPRVRNIEAKMMPFLLRETLVDSGQWGAVRVVKDPDPAAELLIFGTIVRSDGDYLDLRIRAVDAAGYTWLDQVFSARATDVEATEDDNTPVFQELYEEIGNALFAMREQIGDKAVANIQGVSLMRYAQELAPSAFAGYIGENDDGTLYLLRLPARTDPMLQRIETIRSTEYVITDTVDAKFREFNADLTRTYQVWRQYRRKLVNYKAGNVQFAQSKEGQYESGTWSAIKHRYEAYKYHRMTSQEQDRLAVAFNTEVGATVEAMEDRVQELEGWVQHGYVEWRGLLEELHEVETRSRDDSVSVPEELLQQ